MKIILLSDIHANIKALEKIESKILSADYILCLGDYVGYGKNVNEVLNFIKNLPNATCVLGNHDNYLLHGINRKVNPLVIEGIEYATKHISNDNKEWLYSLPEQKAITLDDKTFLLQHGSPINFLEQYLYPDNPDIDRFFELGYDVVAFGHTHHPILRKKDDRFLVNPGSVGQSRNVKNKVCYALYDTVNKDIQLEQVEL